jgi:hypothetical protein
VIDFQLKVAAIDSLANSALDGVNTVDQTKTLAETMSKLVGERQYGDALSDVGIELATKATGAMKILVNGLKTMKTSNPEDLWSAHEAILGTLGSALAVSRRRNSIYIENSNLLSIYL